MAEETWLIIVGAITATATATSAMIALLNWRNRSKVEVRCKPNMVGINDPRMGVPIAEGIYINVSVVNKGYVAITITHLVGFYCKNHWDRILGKRQWFFVNTIKGDIPRVLQPGETWLGFINQEDEFLKKMDKNKILYCGINHSMDGKAIMKRVRLDRESHEQTKESIKKINQGGDK